MTSSRFDRLSIAVTGTLSHFTRRQAIDAIEKHGGRFAKGVSTQTSYLVAGSGGGSKLAKARKLNVPIIDEDRFISLLGGELGDIPEPNAPTTYDFEAELDTVVEGDDGVSLCSQCGSVELVKFTHEFDQDPIWVCEGTHTTAARHVLYQLGYEPAEWSYSGNTHRVGRGCGRDETSTTVLEEEVTCTACLGRLDGAVHLPNDSFEPVCNVAHIHQVRLTMDPVRLTCPTCREFAEQ